MRETTPCLAALVLVLGYAGTAAAFAPLSAPGVSPSRRPGHGAHRGAVPPPVCIAPCRGAAVSPGLAPGFGGSQLLRTPGVHTPQQRGASLCRLSESHGHSHGGEPCDGSHESHGKGKEEESAPLKEGTHSHSHDSPAARVEVPTELSESHVESHGHSHGGEPCNGSHESHGKGVEEEHTPSKDGTHSHSHESPVARAEEAAMELNSLGHSHGGEPCDGSHDSHGKEDVPMDEPMELIVVMDDCNDEEQIMNRHAASQSPDTGKIRAVAREETRAHSHGGVPSTATHSHENAPAVGASSAMAMPLGLAGAPQLSSSIIVKRMGKAFFESGGASAAALCFCLLVTKP